MAPSGMPKVRTARFRVVHGGSLAMVSASVAGVSFIANGPQAPVQSALGQSTVADEHQPMGWDQWTALYERYVVKGSKITIQFGGPSDSAQSVQAGTVGVYLSDQSTPQYTRASSFREAKKGTTKTIMRDQRSVITVKSYYSPKRFHGIEDIGDNFDRLGSSVSGLPSELVYYIVWGQTSGVPFTNNFVSIIDYIVEFSQPKDLPRST